MNFQILEKMILRFMESFPFKVHFIWNKSGNFYQEEWSIRYTRCYIGVNMDDSGWLIDSETERNIDLLIFKQHNSKPSIWR